MKKKSLEISKIQVKKLHGPKENDRLVGFFVMNNCENKKQFSTMKEILFA